MIAKSVGIAVLATCAAGAASARTNVGLVDYAYAPSDAGCVPLDGKSKYALPKDVKASAVRKGDVYEVVLKKVKLDAFKADVLSKNGQFAVVARAFEMSGSPENAPEGLDFRPEAAAGGRVIYYSDDVKQQQSLNFGLIPMFGPVPYLGNPVGFSLFMVEVDSAKDNAKMSAMLSTLAGAGKLVSVPATPVFNLLESLGTALINGNRDDLLMRYDSMLRSPEKARPDLKSAFFRYGDYVMIRQEDRATPIDWVGVYYDSSTATIYQDAKCIEPYKKKPYGYGVVQVNSAKAVAYYQAQSFGKLREAIDQFEKGDVDAITKAANQIREDLAGKADHRRSLDVLQVLETNQRENSMPGADTMTQLASRLRSVKDDLDILNGVKPGKAKISRDQAENIVERLNLVIGTDAFSIGNLDVDAAVAQVKESFKKP